MDSTAPVQPVVLGRIGAPQGVRGWVRVQSYARPPEAILDFQRWFLDAGTGWQARRVIARQVTAKGHTVRLAGCDDRDTAIALRHAAIAVDRDDLPSTGADEWYWADLVGLTVETVEGVVLGRVAHLLETGAHDVLVVRGDRERLIPWVLERVIQRVDLEHGRLVVDWDSDFQV